MRRRLGLRRLRRRFSDAAAADDDDEETKSKNNGKKCNLDFCSLLSFCSFRLSFSRCPHCLHHHHSGFSLLISLVSSASLHHHNRYFLFSSRTISIMDDVSFVNRLWVFSFALAGFPSSSPFPHRFLSPFKDNTYPR